MAGSSDRPKGSSPEANLPSWSAPDRAAADTSARDRVGQIILGRYKIESELARGGMGVVYRGTQIGLSRPVAIKILAPKSGQSDPQFAKRFFLEASTSARLVHPNIVTVHDYGESEAAEMFIVMELLEGRPLSDLITKGRWLPLDRVLKIATQICRALREAHIRGVVHRDLKSSNVMILDGSDVDDADMVKVLDFGLVKLLYSEPTDQNLELTETGRFLGSPKYVSPEQVCGKQVDHRADIYSFGILLFQMVAGRLPFSGKDLIEVAYHHMSSPLPPLEVRPDGQPIAPELAAIIRKCCEKEPSARFDSMDEVLHRLRALLPPRPDGTPQVSTGSYAPLAPKLDVQAAARPMSEATFDASLATTNDRRLPLPPRPASILEAQPASKLPWIVAAFSIFALVGAAGVIAWGALYVRDRLDARSVPTPPPEIRVERVPEASNESRVVFDSSPRGARVEENGELIGTTPFIRSYAVNEANPLHKFTFRLKSYEPTTVETIVDGGRLTVHATLRPKVEARRPEVTEPVRAPTMEDAAVSVPTPETPDKPVEVEVPVTEAPKPPEPPPPPPPRNVPSGVLERDLLERTDFQLPPQVLAANRGSKIKIAVLVCTDKSGAVDPARTKILSAPPGSESAVLSAILRWKYKPQEVPLCSPVHFTVEVRR